MEFYKNAYYFDNSLQVLKFLMTAETIPSFSSELQVIDTQASRGNPIIEKIILPDNCKMIGAMAFSECPELKEVTLGNFFETFGVSAFENCPNLEKVSFNSKIFNISQHCFFKCNFKELTLPKNILYIGECAFSNNVNLKSLIWNANCDTVSEFCFSNCGFETIDLSETNIRYIAKGAFCDCRNLRIVYLPKGIEKIDKTAFDNCPRLEELIIPNKEIDGLIGINNVKMKHYDSLDRLLNKGKSFKDINAMFKGLEK